MKSVVANQIAEFVISNNYMVFFLCLFFSIVQTDESIVPILALDKASQTEKEFNR